MADLRSKFLEDYAGGFLNVSRQELASTGEVLSQDGFLSEETIFVEDGVGVKSGLKLGVGLAETVDPTTQLGIVNVRYADRTYTKIKDTKVFLTAIASSQAALSDAVTNTVTNIENAIETLDVSNMNLDRRLSSLNDAFFRHENDYQNKIQTLERDISEISNNLEAMNIEINGENLTVGELTFGNLTRGAANIGIGYNSLTKLTTGSENILLGNNINGLERGNNNIYIGHNVKASSDIVNNEIIIGNEFHNYIQLSSDHYVPGPKEELSTLDPETCYDFIKNLVPIRANNTMDNEDYLFDIDNLKTSQGEYNISSIVHNGNISKSKLIPILVGAIIHLSNLV